MDSAKATLKGTRWFHNVNPSELDGLHEHIEWLEAVLHAPCRVWQQEDGTEFLIEIRQLVERVSGLRVEIYPNEHPPPHFHVVSPNVDASFAIEDCSRLKGRICSQDERKIRYWHKHAKSLLIQQWNSNRPTNCVVGAYAGS